MKTTNSTLTFRMTAEDAANVAKIAAAMSEKHCSPFITRTDAIRHALRCAVSDPTATNADTQPAR